MPNTSDIAAQHRVFLVFIRLVTFVAFWFGLFPLTIAIVNAIAERDFRQEDFIVPFGIGLGLSGFAVLFWKAAPWLARVAMPRPTRVLCPSCGFDLENAVSDRCNECGLALSEEFRQGTVLAGSAAAPPARLAALQGTMIGVARIVAATAFIPCGFYCLVMLIQVVQMTRYQADLAPFTAMLFAASLGPAACIACLVPWVLPRWTGRRLAPALVKAYQIDQPPPNPARSVTVGAARIVALIASFPLVGALVPLSIYLLDELYDAIVRGRGMSSIDEDSFAISIAALILTAVSLTIALGAWLRPNLAGRLLLPEFGSRASTEPNSEQNPPE